MSDIQKKRVRSIRKFAWLPVKGSTKTIWFRMYTELQMYNNTTNKWQTQFILTIC